MIIYDGCHICVNCVADTAVCVCEPVSVAVEERDTPRLSLAADLSSAGERLEQ